MGKEVCEEEDFLVRQPEGVALAPAINLSAMDQKVLVMNITILYQR